MHQSAPAPKLSVLLVNWNGLADTRHCLRSIEAQSFRDFETILADNGSTDGSTSAIPKEFPWVTFLPLGRNTGFATANNEAAKKAKGALLFVVNTDTEFPENLFATLIEAAKRYPAYDIFSPLMLCFDERNLVDCKGMRFCPYLAGRMIGQGETFDEAEKPFDIFGATGGAMLLRREVYEKIALFDDVFFFNNEDVDFALRAFDAGYKTLYLPSAQVFHKRSPNERRMPDRVLYFVQRNLLLAALKNIPWPLWLTHGALFGAYNAYQAMKWKDWEKAKIVFQAKLDAMKLLKETKRTPMNPLKLYKALGKTKLS